MRRLRVESGHLSNEFNMKYVWQAIRDWKIYIHMLICMAGFCPIYSFALFLPTIIKNMGYTSNEAQLMSVPPYVFACIFTISASWYADRVKKRGIFLLGFQFVGIAGFSMLVATSNPSAQYAGTVLAAIGKLGPVTEHRKRPANILRYLSTDSTWYGLEQWQYRG